MGKTKQLLTFVAMLKRAHSQIVLFTSSCVTAFPWRLRAGAVPKEGERGSIAHVVRAVEGRVVFLFFQIVFVLFFILCIYREKVLLLVLCLVLIYYTLPRCIGCIRHRMEHKALIICACTLDT